MRPHAEQSEEEGSRISQPKHQCDLSMWKQRRGVAASQTLMFRVAAFEALVYQSYTTDKMIAASLSRERIF